MNESHASNRVRSIDASGESPRSMSSIEFLARCKSYRRYQALMSVLFIVAFAAAMFIGSWLEREGGCASDSCFFLVLTGAVASGSVMIYTLLVAPKKRAQHLGLTCPSCGKSLVGSDAQPGMVTGHCAFCRAKVLDS